MADYRVQTWGMADKDLRGLWSLDSPSRLWKHKGFFPPPERYQACVICLRDAVGRRLASLSLSRRFYLARLGRDAEIQRNSCLILSISCDKQMEKRVMKSIICFSDGWILIRPYLRCESITGTVENTRLNVTINSYYHSGSESELFIHDSTVCSSTTLHIE